MQDLELKQNKKGQVGSIQNLITGVGITGAIIAIVAYVISQIQTTANFTANSSASNATTQSLSAINTGASWLPIVVVAGLGAVVIAFIVNAFQNKR